MDPATLGLIAMGVGGAVKVGADIFDNTAGKQAALMHQSASLKRAALDETMSRAFGQQTQVLSSTKARMAGDGFDLGSSSFTDYIHTMATQFESQNQYARGAGDRSADMMDQSADMLADPTAKMFKTTGDIFGTLGALGATAKGV